MADERMPQGQPPGPEGNQEKQQKTPTDPQAPPQPQGSKPAEPKPVELAASKPAAPSEPKAAEPAAAADTPAAKADAPADKPAAKTAPTAAGASPAPAAAKPTAPAAPGAKPAAPAAKPAAPPAPKAPAVMAATPWESELTAALAKRFGDAISAFSTYLGQNFLVARPEAVVPIIEYLKTDEGFDYLVDVTAVDYPKRAERFDLVYILYSFGRNERIRVKTAIADGYKPQSVTGVHPTADWLEREVFDMFGIEFAGHPDLKRILLPDEWEGHPLRKDKAITDMDTRWVKENLSIESAQ